MEIFHMSVLFRCWESRCRRLEEAPIMCSVPAVTKTHGKAFEHQFEKKCIAVRGAEYGGIFDLYSLYTGVPRDKVRKLWLRNWECLITGLNPKEDTAAGKA